MIYVFGDYTLDTERYELRQAGELCKLEPQVFNVLAYLLEHRARVVTKEELLARLWPNQFVSEVTVNHGVMAARRAIGDSGQAQRCIKTLHGRGYRFIADVTVMGQPLVDLPTPTSASFMPTAGIVFSLRPPGVCVAREAEFAVLRQSLTMALHGQRQVVFLSGEAGIGKTTLVDAFVTDIAPATAWWVGRGQCIDQYGAGEAYLPLLEALGQWCRAAEGAQLVALLHQQAPHWLLQMPAFLSPTAYDDLQRRCSGTTRDRMLRELAEALETLTAQHPLILILEDLHWSDYATLDWLASVARRRVPARLLVLGTYRPVEARLRAHPVRTVAQELQRQGHAHELHLPSLSEAGVMAYVTQRFGADRLPAALARVLHQRTNGHPFFLVTIVEEWVRKGYLVALPDGWAFHGALETVGVGVPDSARQLIERQLEDVSEAEHEVLTAASVAGAEFSAAAVAAALGQTAEHVEARCETMAQRGQFLHPQGTAAWPDGTMAARYRFRHALYHEVLYERVPPSQRIRWHCQIGLRLEEGYGPQTHDMAAELAMHFVRGREMPRAVLYLRHAAENALHRYANREAMYHLTTGLEVLKTLPNTLPYLQHELAMLIALGPALLAIKGYGAPEVAHTYTRAHALCQQVGDTQQRCRVLWGLWAFSLVRAEHQTARDLAEQLFTQTQHQADAALQAAGHVARGLSHAFLGAFPSAREHLARAVTLSTPPPPQATIALFGMDLGVFGRAWLSHVLWHLGYPDQALAVSQEALAQDRGHPFSQVIAQDYAAMLAQFRREAHRAGRHAQAARQLGTEQEFAYYLAWGTILQGWARAAQHQGPEGIDQMRQGLAALRATGGAARLPYYLALLAEACGHAGQAAEGLTLVADALAHTAAQEEYWCEAELHRLKGTLLEQQAAGMGSSLLRDAETCLRQALTVARRQQAKALELRAALSLSRLWQQQDKRTEAYELLAAVYGWFTEGFDTADLQEAKALLEELAG
jgi:DNA-binding winged helix-turn-helix (wHTH) protein/predicted ATPase